MFSTIKESYAPFGKIVDNNTKVNPAYIEEKDSLSKKAAVKAWKDFFEQNPATHGYELALDPLQVFELTASIAAMFRGRDAKADIRSQQNEP